MSTFNTISLIGMPGAGKSTVGVLLAKMAGLRFIDTDLSIQVRQEATLQEILERDGYRRLRELEEEVVLGIALDRALISTGGSVVYSARIMQRLKAAGPVVYLQVELPVLEQRVAKAPPRGIASDGAQSFAEIYAERTPLYRHFADCTIEAGDASAEEVAAAVLTKLSGLERT